MPIPESLDDWTAETVRALIDDGYHESDTFEFKEVLDARGTITTNLF